MFKQCKFKLNTILMAHFFDNRNYLALLSNCLVQFEQWVVVLSGYASISSLKPYSFPLRKPFSKRNGFFFFFLSTKNLAPTKHRSPSVWP